MDTIPYAVITETSVGATDGHWAMSSVAGQAVSVTRQIASAVATVSV